MLAFSNYLQTPTDNNKEICRLRRNLAKNFTKNAHRSSSERYINNIEHDIHRRQEVTFKIMKHLNRDEKDTALEEALSRSKSRKVTGTDCLFHCLRKEKGEMVIITEE